MGYRISETGKTIALVDTEGGDINVSRETILVIGKIVNDNLELLYSRGKAA